MGIMTEVDAQFVSDDYVAKVVEENKRLRSELATARAEAERYRVSYLESQASVVELTQALRDAQGSGAK